MATRAVADEAPAQRRSGGPTGGVLRRPIKCPVTAIKRKTCIANKNSAADQMGDRLATIDGRKIGRRVPFFRVGGGAGSPSNTMWPEPRPIPPCQVSSWSIQPFGHNTPTSQTDSMHRRDWTDSGPTAQSTILQMVAQN